VLVRLIFSISQLVGSMHSHATWVANSWGTSFPNKEN